MSDATLIPRPSRMQPDAVSFRTLGVRETIHPDLHAQLAPYSKAW
ncbi:hypothetical protein [Microbacterium schleiferi]|nr:hypothetical protein [Microbacterium schleiferi]